MGKYENASLICGQCVSRSVVCLWGNIGREGEREREREREGEREDIKLHKACINRTKRID